MPADLSSVLYAESRLSSTADNGIAKGLNQITWVAASGWLTKDEWENIPKLSIDDQLPLVEKSLLQSKLVGGKAGPFLNATEIYQANFAPASLRRGSADDLVLYRSLANGGDAKEDARYKANQGLDTRKRGQIEVGDLRRRLVRTSSEKPFQDFLFELNRGQPNLGRVPGQGSFTGTWLIPIGLAGLGVVMWHRKVSRKY